MPLTTASNDIEQEKTVHMPYPVHRTDQIFFLHVPKAAGTTLTEILKKQSGKDAFLSYDPMAQFLQQESLETVMQYRILRSHANYDVAQLLPRKPIFITMLRNPVDQVISHYHHLRYKAKPLADGGKELTPDTALFDFVTKPLPTDRVINNLQTMILAGKRQFASLSPEDALEIARIHLSECAWFGLQERFDDSIQLLSNTFGWNEIKNYQSRNVTSSKAKSEIETSEIDLIMEHNQLDLALYQYAESLFETRFQAMLQRYDKHENGK